jgi:hypothetical protein
MPVGSQMTSVTCDQVITSLAVQMRNLMDAVNHLALNTGGTGAAGLAYLESIGYSPGDAATAQTAIGWMNTLSGMYFGAEPPTEASNFNTLLSAFWAGQ